MIRRVSQRRNVWREMRRAQDRMVREILEASDEEIVRQAQEAGYDVQRVADHCRVIFERARQEAARRAMLRGEGGGVAASGRAVKVVWLVFFRNR